MRRDKWVLAILITLLGLLVFLRPSYGWWLKDAVFSPLTRPSAGNSNLASENLVLKAEIAELQSVKSQVGTPPPASVTAVVFSRYPLNFKEEVLIAAGQNEGLAEGQAVLYKGVLLGKVEKVFSETALVMTVFDSRFQLAVRVGGGAVDALLQGGASPEVALIPKKSIVAQGDAVYSAAPTLPYGLAVGELGSVRISASQLFLESPLDLPYVLYDVRAVSVLKSIPQQ